MHKSSLPKKAGFSLNAGFTLIEMLVVIAIIALLVSLIAPAVGNSLRSAKSSACRSNLHQAGIAITTYCADHYGKLPSTGFYGIAPYYNRDQRNFQNSLRAYLNLPEASTWSTNYKLSSHAKTFDCPAYPGPVNGKCYTMSRDVETINGEEVNPWGNISTATGKLSSQPYSIEEIRPDEIAIRDLDYGNEVSHKNHRNALFFDLSVQSVDLDNEL